MPCTVWLCRASTYNSFASARFFAAFTASVSQTVPASIISETFRPEHRGAAVSAWTMFLVVGAILAPLISAGILTKATDWRWASASTESERKDSSSNGCGHPTLTLTSTDSLEKGLPHGSVGAAWYPWKEPGRFSNEIVSPLKMVTYVSVLLPSILYALIFMWAVGFTIISPQTLPGPPWHFTNVQVGLSFIAAAVGALIGLFAGAYVSDRTVDFFAGRNSSTLNQSKRVPEYRL